MNIEDAIEFACPYCGETNILEDLAGESPGRIIMDCAVCCRPMECEWTLESGTPVLSSVQPG